MEYPSRFLNAYYEAFNPQVTEPEKIAEEVAENVKRSFGDMCNQVIEINELLQRYYLEEKDLNFCGSFVDPFESSDDDFEALSKALEFMTCQNEFETAIINNPKFLKDLLKVNKVDREFDEFVVHLKYLCDRNELDVVEQWFCDCVKKIKEKIAKKKYQIQYCLICILFCAIEGNYLDSNWFQFFLFTVKRLIPNCWTNSVYCYCLAIKYKIFDYFKFEKKKLPLSQCQHAYNAIVCTCLVRHIKKLDKENGSIPYSEITEADLKFYKMYFGDKGNFKSKFQKTIYFKDGDKHGNRIPNTSSQKTLFNIGMILFLRFLYKQQESRGKKNKVNNFIKTICPGFDVKKDIWSIAKDYFKDPSEGELYLIESVKESLKIRNDKKLLVLFTKTEEKLRTKVKHSAIEGCIQEINEIRNSNKSSNQSLSDILRKLISHCEKIDLDFSKIDVKYNIKKDYGDIDYIIHCLSRIENCIIDSLKTDIFYADDIEHKRYDSIRQALYYRSTYLSASFFNVYKNVVNSIETFYYSKQCTENCKYTERDYLSNLNAYAWHKFSKEKLSDYIKNNDACFELIRGSELFRLCNILDDKGEFINKDEYLSCAAMGFVEGDKNYSSQEVTDILIELLRKYCNDSDYKGTHFEFFSKEFLLFATTAILALSHSYKKEVISALCDKANSIIIAKERKDQQTLIYLLNTVLIQPKVRLDANTSSKVMKTIFNRVLYPMQMQTIQRLEQHPFLKSILSEHKDILSNPELIDGYFPSPFFMYIFANEYAAMAKDEKVACALDLKDKKIVWKKDAKISETEIPAFYKLSILLEGISWRITNSVDSQHLSIDKKIFVDSIKMCSGFWQDTSIDKTNANNKLLMLTWGTELLLTAFCNLARDNKFFSIDDKWDYKTILNISLNADLIQRKYNKGYQDFLSNKDPIKSDFWLISGAFRFTSLISKKKLKKTCFFREGGDETKLYIDALKAEKDTQCNYRFYILLSRLLSTTNFFELVDTADVAPTKEKLPENVYKLFLPYDNIDSYIKSLE